MRPKQDSGVAGYAGSKPGHEERKQFTTSVGGERGYDGAKKLAGRKRHILVDTEGLLVAVNVHPANVMDPRWHQACSR